MLNTGITHTAMQSVEAHTPVPAQVTQTVVLFTKEPSETETFKRT